MKILIIYSSATGNTKAVAEAIAKSLPGATLVAARDVTENPVGCDLVFAVFGTCGAYPDSEAAQVYQRNAAAVPAGDNESLGTFMCQGRVHSYHIKCQHKMESTVQPMTPERQARLEEAEKHPDKQDFARAVAWAAEMVRKAQA